jgi:hypothetical protein
MPRQLHTLGLALFIAGIVGGSTFLATRGNSSDVRSAVAGAATDLAPAVAAPTAVPASRVRFREYTIPAGTRLDVRLQTPVSSRTSRVEDRVQAVLASPIVLDDTEVLPGGSMILGNVSSVRRSGKVKGRASVAMQFTSVALPGTGQRYAIASSYARVAPATKADDAKKIAIPAAGGAVVGAIVGGKKGAAIGSAIGGGAGTAVVLSTAGHEVDLGRGRRMVLRLQRSVTVRVAINQ